MIPHNGICFSPDFIDALDRAVREREGQDDNGEVRFRCPAPEHADVHPSAMWNREKGAWRCWSCKAKGGALDLADRLGIPKPRRGHHRGEGTPIPSQTSATVQQAPGCTLARYAEAKGLPLDRLRAFGPSDIYYQGRPAVRMPYRDERRARRRCPLSRRLGEVGRRRRPLPLEGRRQGLPLWAGPARSCPRARLRCPSSKARAIVIPSGVTTSRPSVVPGAANWKEERDAPELDGIATIYVVVERRSGR